MLDLEGEGKREGGKKCDKTCVHERERTVSCGECGGGEKEGGGE